MPKSYRYPADQILALLLKRGPIMPYRKLLPMTRHNQTAASLKTLLKVMQRNKLIEHKNYMVELTPKGAEVALEVLEERGDKWLLDRAN